MEQINLNLIPNGVNPVAHCKQYDVGRTFRCNLFEGTSVYTLDGTETVECEVQKPDGNLVTLALTNTGSTYVDVTTTLQMCACSGESLAAIKITSGGVEIGSLNFVLYCERSPLEGGITSDSGIYNLETQVSSLVATEVANQYDSANVIFDAEPQAGHGNGYAVTSEGIVDYVNPEATIENVSIASFDNGGDGVPVKELIVGIEPVQASGTPTPSSPLAISGFSNAVVYSAGKNLLPTHADISVSGGAQVTNSLGSVYLKEGETYTISCVQTPQSVTSQTRNCFLVKKPDNTMIYGTNGVSIPPITVTAATSGLYEIRIWSNNLSESVVYSDFQAELGSTATTYEAYNGTTDTISLGGTVYGGELNVTTGELTISLARTKINALTWTYSSGFSCFTSSSLTSTVAGGNEGVLCEVEEFLSVPLTTANINANDNFVRFNKSASGTAETGNFGAGVLVLKDTDYSDVATMTAAIGDNYITYPLATPTTTTLTPTEVATVLGYNNIYADTGDVVSVTYIKDNASVLYPFIDKKADKPSPTSMLYVDTWSPIADGNTYLFIPLVGATSMQNRISITTWYSTDGTTWSNALPTSELFTEIGIIVYTDDTNAAGCVARISFDIS